jgi:7,8-dihydropterin-6-yl-methyl-4-(beta-D-ribofuranosyl)aminobenzene 5'-phosphate synthase
MAEHGFSALVTVRRGDTTTSVLFDTGLSQDAMVTNADRPGEWRTRHRGGRQ